MVLPLVLIGLLHAATVVQSDAFDVDGFLKSCTEEDESLICSEFEFDAHDENRLQTTIFEISSAPVIKFQNARIGAFNENLVNKFPSATEFIIFNCQLSLHSNITSISTVNMKLEKLTIDMSLIRGNEQTTAFKKLTALRELVISNPYYVEYANIDDDLLENNPNLETVVFDRMQLNTLGPNSFANQQILKNLTITNNFISYIPGSLLENNQELEFVDLSRNGIVDLPLGFFPPSTKFISFNNNVIQAISDRHFKGLVDLEYLNLCFNRIGIFSLQALADAEQLKVLNLHSNQITFFEKGHFVNNVELEEINLSINKFASLPNNLFDGLEKLKNIQIFE